MDYELAKQLKDAGFPQKGINYDEGGRVMLSGPFIKGNPIDGGLLEGVAYSPTLSELIEACGDKFDYLERGVTGGWFAYHENFRPTEEEILDDVGEGPTPEEAVGRLWLALNRATEHHPTVTS